MRPIPLPIQTLRLSPTRNMHFGYVNPNLHVTSKIHSVQNPGVSPTAQSKIDIHFSHHLFFEHFSRHLHHHSCIIPLHTRASTIAARAPPCYRTPAPPFARWHPTWPVGAALGRTMETPSPSPPGSHHLQPGQRLWLQGGGARGWG
jgi:hypothetical protein